MSNIKFYLVIAAVAVVSVIIWNKYIAPKVGINA